jgi:hypothetical protein
MYLVVFTVLIYILMRTLCMSQFITLILYYIAYKWEENVNTGVQYLMMWGGGGGQNKPKFITIIRLHINPKFQFLA